MTALKMQNHLINDIIDFSQINAGLIEIRFNSFKLADLIQEITALFENQFTMKRLGLAFIVDEGVPQKIKTDYERLL
jgi:signal transduction histidine kinase